MKVIHVLNTGIFSGAENVAISIIAHTQNEIESVYVSLAGSIGEVLDERGIKYYPIPKLNVINLKRVIAEEKPDVIHAHDFTASVTAAMCCTSIPIISHLHHNSPWLKRVNLKSIAYGLTYMKYERIFTVSEAVMKEYVFGEILKKKVLVIGNPVVPNEIKEKALLAELKDRFDVVYIGRFVKEKNPELFLNIIKQVTMRLPNLSVAMIGSGDMFEEIQLKIKNMNLENNITCLGFISNPYGVLRASKLLCIPSRWEGFGLVAVEALALGKPVVAANVGGLPDIVNDKCGRICSQLEDYVGAIEKLLTDTDYYNQICMGALKRSEELENEETYFENIKKVYARCVDLQ